MYTKVFYIVGFYYTNIKNWHNVGDDAPRGWYFSDETDADIYGPYQTEAEAIEGLKEYAKTL